MEPKWIEEIAAVFWPLIQMAVSLLGPVLITWLSVRLAAVLNVKEEKDKAALEKQLRDSLHAASQNAWMFALKKLNLSFTDLGKLPGGDLVKVIDMAKEYVADKNPDSIQKLGVTDSQLEDILLTKLPVSATV